MKILQINSVAGVGSTGKIAAEINNTLIETGHESYIAYGRNESKALNNTIKIGNPLSIYWHVFISRIFDRTGYGSVIATKRFIRKVKKLNPDIIHLHNIHGYYINLKSLFKYLKNADKPVLWTLHDCWSFTGHCAYFDYVGCNKWKEICHDCPQIKTYPKSLFWDNSNKNFIAKKQIFTGVKNMTLITPSNWLAEVVKKSFLKVYPIKAINNGIDLNVFKPTKSDFRQKYGLNDKIILIGVASPWSRRKGLSIFVELSKMLDDRYKIVLVGLSKKQIKTLPQNILGITRTNNAEELAGMYTAADYLLNPSAEETMGLVAVEALACGTPVIVSNLTAVPEMISKECGIVVEKNSSEGFYQVLTKNTKTFTPESCINHARRFDKNIKYEQYIEQYKEF